MLSDGHRHCLGAQKANNLPLHAHQARAGNAQLCTFLPAPPIAGALPALSPAVFRSSSRAWIRPCHDATLSCFDTLISGVGALHQL